MGIILNYMKYAWLSAIVGDVGYYGSSWSIAVWTKPSSTTAGMYSSTGPITPLPICAAAADLSSQPNAAAMCGEDLLHDARNLMSVLGLYCDLLRRVGAPERA